MTPRIRQLVWEQARQSVWMIFALATGVFPCIVAEVILRLEDAVPRLQAVFFLKAEEAVHLCDLWVCISSLAVSFGMLMSQERKSEFSIALPTRLLRLPVGTPLLSSIWVSTRLILALSTIAALLGVRQVAISGKTDLLFMPSFVLIASGCFVMMGAVRLAEAWSDKAAWGTVLLVLVVGGLFKDMQYYAKEHPFTTLDICVVAGLCAALTGFALRRRGGVLSGLDLLSLRQGAQYTRIADIPRFASQADAQTWWEWRFSGRVFPALVLIGCCIATGPIFIRPVLQTLGIQIDLLEHQFLGIREPLLLLIAVPLWCATIASIQLAARSAFRRDRPQGRFLRVRPMSGWTYSVARHRMLRRSAAFGFAVVPFFVIVVVVHWVKTGQPHDFPGFAASEVIRAVENLLFPVKYSVPSFTITRGSMSDAIVMCLGYALAFAALLTVANGVLPLVIFLTIVAITLLGGLTRTYENLSVIFNVFPMLLTCLALAQAVYIGVISLRRGLLFGTTGIILIIVTAMLDGNALMAIVPFGLVCAILAGAIPSVALTHHAARVADFRPARLACARLDWHDARGLLQVTAALVLVAGALLGTWRWTVSESLRLELARLDKQGIPPLPDQRVPVEPAPAPAKTSQIDASGESNAHLRALITACAAVRLKVFPDARALRIDGPTPALSTEAEGVPLEDAMPFPAAASRLFDHLKPQFDAIRTAGAAISPDDLQSTDNVDALRGGLHSWLALAIHDGAQQSPQTAEDLRVAVALFNELWRKDHTPYRRTRYSENDPAALGLALEYVAQRASLPMEALATLEASLPRERQEAEYRESFRALSLHDYVNEYDFNSGRSYEVNFYGDIPLHRHLDAALLLIPTASYAAYLHEMSQAYFMHGGCFQWTGRNDSGISFPTARVEGINVDVPFATWESTSPAAAHRALHRADGTMALLRQALILEEYRAKFGAYPEELTHCKVNIVPKLPVDWSHFGEQQPCGYERFSDTSCKVWAAGDGYDNRGLRHSYEGERGTDIVIHLNRAQ